MARRGRPPTSPWLPCETCGHSFKFHKGNANRFCSLKCRFGARRDATFVAEARRLWSEGLSAAQIAKRMGVTKNVISGVSNRNDFPARPSPILRAPSVPRRADAP